MTDLSGTDASDRWGAMLQALSGCGNRLRQLISNELAEQELPEAGWLVLRACAASSSAGMAQHQLAEELGLSAATISGWVEQLRVRGWLVSQRGTIDRRRQWWRATTAGLAALAQSLSRLAPLADRLQRQFPMLKRQQLDLLLNELQAALASEADENATVISQEAAA